MELVKWSCWSPLQQYLPLNTDVLYLGVGREGGKGEGGEMGREVKWNWVDFSHISHILFRLMGVAGCIATDARGNSVDASGPIGNSGNCLLCWLDSTPT